MTTHERDFADGEVSGAIRQPPLIEPTERRADPAMSWREIGVGLAVGVVAVAVNSFVAGFVVSRGEPFMGYMWAWIGVVYGGGAMIVAAPLAMLAVRTLERSAPRWVQDAVVGLIGMAGGLAFCAGWNLPIITLGGGVMGLITALSARLGARGWAERRASSS